MENKIQPAESIEKFLLTSESKKVFPQSYIIELVEEQIKILVNNPKYKDRINKVTYSESKIPRTVIIFKLNPDDKYTVIESSKSFIKEYNFIKEFKLDLDKNITNDNNLNEFSKKKNIDITDYHVIFKINFSNNNGVLGLEY
jgi:hypothetical protein